MKIRMRASVSALALVATPVLAAQAEPAGRAESQSTAAGQATTPDGIADIVVTATKIETTLQKTSETITAINPDTLLRAGITSPQALNKLVSGLQVETNGPASSIYIRGVGSRVLTPIADPAVAFSVDGIYYARPLGNSVAFFDLARVEVVKGPQGTLYGRNATGGAVNLITNHPVLGVRSIDGEIEVGDYNAIRAAVAVNLPVGDNLAIRLAAQSTYHDGYLSDGYDDQNVKSLRASLFYKPSDTFSLYFSGDYGHQGGMGAAAVPVGPGSNSGALTTRFVVPSNPWTGPSDPRVNALVAITAPATAIPGPTAGTFCLGAPIGPVVAVGVPAVTFCGNPLGLAPVKADGFVDNTFYGANLTMNADIGLGELTAIGGYRRSEIRTFFYVDPRPQAQSGKIDQYTAELRLASKPGDSRLKWLIGGFYLNEKQNTQATNSLGNTGTPNPFPSPGSPLPATTCRSPFDPDGPGPAPAVAGVCVVNAIVLNSLTRVDPNVTNETYAAFGQLTFSLTDNLRVTGGIRYTHEKKAEKGGVISSMYTVPAGVVVSYPTEGEVAYSDISYRGGIEIDVARQSMLYATYSTAFHAGGFNFGVRQGPNVFEYQPEKVRSYVIGSKNRFFNNRLQINLEGFWLDYDNYQQNLFGRINDGSTACSTLNIVTACPLTVRTENAATARVRGVEADFVVQPFTHTTLNVNVLYNDATFLKFRVPNPATGVATVYDGARLPGSVPWTVNAGISQAFPLVSGGRIIADARTQYKSGAYLWFTNVPAVYQEGYTRSDLSLTYEAPGKHYSLSVFVRNVENKATISQGGPTSEATGIVDTNLNPPRTFGAAFGFHF